MNLTYVLNQARPRAYYYTVTTRRKMIFSNFYNFNFFASPIYHRVVWDQLAKNSAEDNKTCILALTKLTDLSSHRFIEGTYSKVTQVTVGL